MIHLRSGRRYAKGDLQQQVNTMREERDAALRSAEQSNNERIAGLHAFNQEQRLISEELDAANHALVDLEQEARREVLALSSQIRCLEAEKLQLTQEAHDKFARISARVVELEGQVSLQDLNMHAATSQMHALRVDLERKDIILALAKVKISDLEQQTLNLNQQVSDMCIQIARHQKKDEDIAGFQTNFSVAVLGAANQIESLTSQLRVAQTSIQAGAQEVEESKARIQALDDELKDIRDCLAATQTTSEERITFLNAAHHRIELLEEKVKKRDNHIEQLTHPSKHVSSNPAPVNITARVLEPPSMVGSAYIPPRNLKEFIHVKSSSSDQKYRDRTQTPREQRSRNGPSRKV